MSNMDYCQFYNTVGDLKDCTKSVIAALDDGVSEADFIRQMRKEELRAFRSMRQECEDFIAAYDELIETSTK